MVDSVRRLAAALSRLEGDVSAIKRWQSVPQLTHSSIDDGSIAEKDAAGNVVSRWGKQVDGTHGTVIFDGPTPLAPTPPEVEGGQASITAVWDGTLTEDAPVPYDFQTVEVYAATEPFTDVTAATLVGAIPDPDGGRITVRRPVGTWHVGLVVRTQAGKRSAVSDLAVAESESVVDQEVLDELRGAFTTSDREPTAADGEGKPDGAYWTQIDDDGADIARWRWDGEQWNDAPLGMQFIPELGVSKLIADEAGFNTAVMQQLAADEGFIADLESVIVTAQTLLGKTIATAETGQRVELSEAHGIRAWNADDDQVLGIDSATGNLSMAGDLVAGSSLDIPGVLSANAEDGVTVGGALPLWQHLPARDFPGGGTAWTDLTGQVPRAGDEHLLVRGRFEASEDYAREDLVLRWLSQLGTVGFSAPADVVVDPLGSGQVREYAIPFPQRSFGNIRLQVYNPTSGGFLRVSDLEILRPSTGNVEVSGNVSGQVGMFDRLEVNEINRGAMLLHEQNISGMSTDPSAPDEGLIHLPIPEHLQGTFRRYEVNIVGGITGGSGIAPIMVLVNGRFGADHVEYDGAARAETATGQGLVTWETSGGWPRTGFLSDTGWTSGYMSVDLTPRHTGPGFVVLWNTTGHGRTTGNQPFLVRTGGAWSAPGPRQTITHFTIRPANGTDRTWANYSSVQLWGYR